jgi:hypothetical protein
LMAFRGQLSCILLLRIARKVAIATYSHQTVYATLCERLQHAAKPQKTDSKSADPCGHEGSPPPGTTSKIPESAVYKVRKSLPPGMYCESAAPRTWITR